MSDDAEARAVSIRLTAITALIRDQEAYLAQLRLRQVRLRLDLKTLARGNK